MGCRQHAAAAGLAQSWHGRPGGGQGLNLLQCRHAEHLRTWHLTPACNSILVWCSTALAATHKTAALCAPVCRAHQGLLQAWDPDVVLSDFIMPSGMSCSGTAALQTLPVQCSASLSGLQEQSDTRQGSAVPRLGKLAVAAPACSEVETAVLQELSLPTCWTSPRSSCQSLQQWGALPASCQGVRCNMPVTLVAAGIACVHAAGCCTQKPVTHSCL